MSSSVRDDDDRPTRRSPPWTSERQADERQEQDRARHLVDEVAAAAAEIQREALRSRRAQTERWRAEQDEQTGASEGRYLPDINRGLWSPALEPVIMPPPPQEQGSMAGIKMAAGLIGAVAVAAAVAFVLMRAVQVPTTAMVASSDGGSRQSQSFAAPVLSAPVLENLTQITAAEAKVPPAEAPSPRGGTLLANTQANAVAVTTPAPAPPPVSQPSPDVPQAARAVEPSRFDPPARLDPPAQSAPPVAEAPRAVEVLSRDEVLSLRKRGQDLLSVGDIASARLILTRLAEAGDADATLMLAGTYDAGVLAGLHVVGIRPDPAKARDWYARAAELGSSEARLRLQQARR
jgi:hypothetical protein